MSTKQTSLLVIILAVFLLLLSSLFTVTAGHKAILLRLGDIVKNTEGQPKVFDPGLHFKLPFIVKVRDFDARLRSFKVESSRILTAEQKYVLVDYYAKWKIIDPALYYKRTGGFATQAITLMKQNINDALRAAFGQREIKEVISGERLNIMGILLKQANVSAKKLGISVIDVRIERIDLPTAVSESVFQRMRTEREQVATQFRSSGKAKDESLRADADANVAITIAQAKAKAADIRAAGDTKAAAVYAAAYQKDASFYAFYRSLLAYKSIFSHHSAVMVLKPDGHFFRYFLPKNKQLPEAVR